MLGALLLASWLAQSANPAYAQPPLPGPPVPRAPVDDPPVDAANTLGVRGSFAYRPTSGGEALAPAGGYSIGVTFEHSYGQITPSVDAGLELDLFHDHFQSSTDTALSGVPGVSGGISDADHLLMQTSFAALQTIGLHIGPVRLFAGLGGGVTVGYVSYPNVSTDNTDTRTVLQPIARAGAGVDISVRRRFGIVIRADYTHPFTHPWFDGYQPFGDLFDAGVGAVYRF